MNLRLDLCSYKNCISWCIVSPSRNETKPLSFCSVYQLLFRRKFVDDEYCVLGGVWLIFCDQRRDVFHVDQTIKTNIWVSTPDLKANI